MSQVESSDRQMTLKAVGNGSALGRGEQGCTRLAMGLL
jgi:hypothetical protein